MYLVLVDAMDRSLLAEIYFTNKNIIKLVVELVHRDRSNTIILHMYILLRGFDINSLVENNLWF